jgi:hypothetical protein
MQFPCALYPLCFLKSDLFAYEPLQRIFGSTHEMLARRSRNPFPFNHDPAPRKLSHYGNREPGARFWALNACQQGGPGARRLQKTGKALGAGRLWEALPILGDGQPASAPVLHLDFLDNDEGRFLEAVSKV